MTALKPGAEPQPRVGKLNKSPNIAFKEPWTAALYDQLRLFSVQLLCSGGSGALAKTAVAPLERIKVMAAPGGGDAHISKTSRLRPPVARWC